jgi:hypothetical protein
MPYVIRNVFELVTGPVYWGEPGKYFVFERSGQKIDLGTCCTVLLGEIA